jgi:hypothetical protein
MIIVSAKYLYAEDGATKTRIQLNLGTNDAGDTTYKHIPIATNSNDYVEIMDMVEAGELTIQEAD